MSATRSWKDYVLTFIFGVVLLGLLVMAVVRIADVYYKAAWIVGHFPPKATLCSELFCVRTDTSKPEWRFGELHFAYCERHLPSGFQGRRGRSAVFSVLFALIMFILMFISVPIVGGLFRILGWPILIPMRLAGNLPPGRLLPFARYADSSRSAPGDWLEPAGMWTGAAIALVAIGLYCWW